MDGIWFLVVWMDGFSSWKDGVVNKLKYSRFFAQVWAVLSCALLS